jgi:L-threonylcarbamoyladenylate synthase
VAASVSVPAGTAGSALPALLAEPAAALAAGGLVAFPTETVYGLGADALSARAVERIFAAKGRPADNPLIVHLPDAGWVDRVARGLPPLAARLADACWPGPLTLVLDARPGVPGATTAGLSTVAVRVPDHPLARALIRLAGTPVAAPSANLSGRPSPTTAAHVEADLGDRIDWVVDGGPCAVGIESTVVDARGPAPVVLREGAVTREDLEAVAGVPVAAARPPGGGGPARSPGTRHAHYRPDARVVVADPGEGLATAARLAGRGRVGLVGPDDVGVGPGVEVLATPLGADELAAVLYAALRRADRLGLATVVVEAVPAEGLGRAVMDRLRRAAGGRA